MENVTQARNYIRLAKAHPDVVFGAWSKNQPVWLDAFREEGKPDNLSFVVSSLMLNKETGILPELLPYTDHRFTVYTKDHSTDINCGARCCLTCQRCYKKDSDFDVREQLK